LPEGSSLGKKVVMKQSPRTVTPDDLLSRHPSDLRALANRLRTLVRTAVPDATETAYPGWKLIGYRHQGAYFCFVAPKRDHVQLGFEYGVDLHDPEGLLEGRGSQVRHVQVRSSATIPVRSLTRLIRQAAELVQ
jgi:hypothetical protein